MVYACHPFYSNSAVRNCVYFSLTVFLVDWVKSVRESSKDVKIVPRVIFEGWSINDYTMLFASHDRALDVAKTIKHVLLVRMHLRYV